MPVLAVPPRVPVEEARRIAANIAENTARFFSLFDDTKLSALGETG